LKTSALSKKSSLVDSDLYVNGTSKFPESLYLLMYFVAGALFWVVSKPKFA